MQFLYQLLALLGAAAIVWVIYRTIKGQPELFSRDNVSKSLSTLGFLGIFLILFVGFLVLMLNS